MGISMIEVGVTQDVGACLAIRRTVFIEEQNVAEEIEMDGRTYTFTVGEITRTLVHDYDDLVQRPNEATAMARTSAA